MRGGFGEEDRERRSRESRLARKPEPPREAALSTGRVVLIVLGSIVALIGLALAAGGGFLLWVDRTQREGGYLTTPTERFATSTYALTRERLEASARTLRRSGRALSLEDPGSKACASCAPCSSHGSTRPLREDGMCLIRLAELINPCSRRVAGRLGLSSNPRWCR